MKFINKFFEPYEKYSIRTTLTEEELKEIFSREFAPWYNILAGLEIGFGMGKKNFVRTRNPLKLYPILRTRNSLRGELSIKCEKSPSSPDTILHITIAPSNQSLLIWIMLCFSAGIGILMLCAGAWLHALIPLLIMPAIIFTILAISTSCAENEVPEIRQMFESCLRDFEQRKISDLEK